MRTLRLATGINEAPAIQPGRAAVWRRADAGSGGFNEAPAIQPGRELAREARRGAADRPVCETCRPGSAEQAVWLGAQTQV